MMIDTKIINEMLLTGGFDLSFLRSINIPLTIFPELISNYHFTITEAESIKYLMEQYSNKLDANEQNILLNASNYFLNYYISLEKTKNNNYISKLAELFVDSYENQYILQGKTYEPIIFNNYSSSKILDLCSGPEFINFVPIINSTNTYYCIDKSLFVNHVIQYQGKRNNIDNIISIQETNTLFLNYEICNNFNCIRAKNVFKYDNDFCSTVYDYFNRIADTGDIIFQETSFLNQFVYYIQMPGFLEMCRKFIFNGCNYQFIKGTKENELSFDTLLFHKGNIANIEAEWNKFNKFISEKSNYCA
jgi:hypothetical protein